jgi:flagellar hook-associated protein 3 FlgL
MRISTMMMYEQMNQAMQNANSQIANDTTQLSTGKTINKPSDNPVGEQQNLGYTVSIQTNTQYESNMQQANTFLSAADTAFTSANTTLSDLQNLASTGINSNTQGNDADFSQQAANDRDSLLSLANTQVGDQYIFSGFKTNQQAFSFNAATNTYDYNGDLGSIQVPIGNGSSMAMNIQGSNAFSVSLDGATLPTSLSDGTPVSYTQATDPTTGVNTITVTIGNEGDADYDTFNVSNVMDIANVMSSAFQSQNVDGTALNADAGVSQQMAQHRIDALGAVIQGAQNQVLEQQTEVGSRQDALTNQKSMLDQTDLNLEADSSNIDAANTTQLGVAISQADVTLEALESSTASILQTSLSLYDFLA